MRRARSALEPARAPRLSGANSLKPKELTLVHSLPSRGVGGGPPLAVRVRVIWRAAERVAWAIAVLTLTGRVVLRLDGAVASQEQLERFVEARDGKLVARSQPDFTLWSSDASVRA
jgi:hypothetical protein